MHILVAHILLVDANVLVTNSSKLRLKVLYIYSFLCAGLIAGSFLGEVFNT